MTPLEFEPAYGKFVIIIMISGLAPLFNGISTFVGYLMPKPFSKKNSSGTI